VHTPTLQNVPNYFLLALFLPHLFYERRAVRLEGDWWKYVLLAIVDVEANYVLVKAYEYTSVTSIMLLDCFTIPASMLLSHTFLRASYSRNHFFGVAFCAAGIALLVYGDLHQSAQDKTGNSKCEGGDDEPKSALLGDVMVLFGAMLYASSNVGQEALVKRHDRREYLGMLGCFGFLLSVVQLIALESSEISEIQWDSEKVLLVGGYVACLTSMYILTSFFLQHADSAFFNISLLASDFWAVVVGIVLCGVYPGTMYYFSLVLIIVGIFMYSSVPVQFEFNLGETETGARNTTRNIPEEDSLC
jgi:solute carrier family 35 protein F1/2